MARRGAAWRDVVNVWLLLKWTITHPSKPERHFINISPSRVVAKSDRTAFPHERHLLVRVHYEVRHKIRHEALNGGGGGGVRRRKVWVSACE